MCTPEFLCLLATAHCLFHAVDFNAQVAQAPDLPSVQEGTQLSMVPVLCIKSHSCKLGDVSRQGWRLTARCRQMTQRRVTTCGSTRSAAAGHSALSASPCASSTMRYSSLDTYL